MKSTMAPRLAQADAHLIEAVRVRDLKGVAHALLEGADAWRARIPVQKPFAHSPSIADYLVKFSHPVAFLRALAERGALQGDGARNMLQEAITSGNEQAFDFVLSQVPHAQFSERAWMGCFQAKKPHRMLGKLLAVSELPQEEKLRGRMMGGAILRGDLVAVETLFDKGAYFEGMLASPEVLSSGVKNAASFAKFVERVLSVHPQAIAQCHGQGVGVLHAMLNPTHSAPSANAIAMLLAIPALRQEIDFVSAKGALMSLALAAKKDHVWQVVQGSGARFPEPLAGEEKTDYFKRTLERLPDWLTKPQGMDAPWSAVQAQQMDMATPRVAKGASRRF